MNQQARFLAPAIPPYWSMIMRLFQSSAPSAPAPPRVSPETRLYAIGDIHGCMELLRTLLTAVSEDAANHPDKRKILVCLGDYVDRGGDSRAVIDCLLHHHPADF